MSSRDENPPTSSGSVVDVDDLAVEGPSDIRSSEPGLECQRRVLAPAAALVPAPESRLRLVQARIVSVADAEADRDPVLQLAPRDVMRDAVRLELGDVSAFVSCSVVIDASTASSCTAVTCSPTT